MAIQAVQRKGYSSVDIAKRSGKRLCHAKTVETTLRTKYSRKFALRKSEYYATMVFSMCPILSPFIYQSDTLRNYERNIFLVSEEVDNLEHVTKLRFDRTQFFRAGPKGPARKRGIKA
jgi:hypothetical protein